MEKERDALNRQEALRAREQAEYQRKLDALELKSRKGKTSFSDAVRGICTAWRLQDCSGLADDQSQDQSGTRCGGLATSTSRDEVLLQCQPQMTLFKLFSACASLALNPPILIRSH